MKYKAKKQYRLPYYNYASSGYYFVTLCTKNRLKYFGSVQNGSIILSDIGRIVERSWQYIPRSSSFATLDQFVIMPNHLHGIILLDNPYEDRELTEKRFEIRNNSLSVIIRTFKAAVTARVREKHPSLLLWQERYYDRIVRNEKELQIVRNYIMNNPLQWEEDRNNSINILM